MSKQRKKSARVPAKKRNGSSVTRVSHELEELNRIGIALSETRDVERLLGMILLKAREITGADAGSLYLVEHSVGEQPRLRFKLTQNDSVDFPFAESTLPLTDQSIAGYCAWHGKVVELADAYRVPTDTTFHFNKTFDELAGYRTRSLLALPMKNGKGEVLGVLQLLNCKRSRSARLVDAKAVARNVHVFPEHAVRLGSSLASQAAVAYENSKLYHDIENLFDGFVNAAVKAIEQRDPTTSGHSQRVCDMTVALAEAADRESSGPYADLRFSREQMKELRYAALLHDFGKVGVREEVLVKAKKLYPLQYARLMDRFDYIRRDIEARCAEQKVEALLQLSKKDAAKKLKELDAEAQKLITELDRCAEFVARANEPTIMPSGDFELVSEIAQKSYGDTRGTKRPYLTADEAQLLSIPRGSLAENERREIEAHVVHSFQFLAQIPWTQEYKKIPEIARAHHEKLNGKGYPLGLNSSEIPIQAKMMTICDIFDALSATDRPYKKAVPTDRALDILRLCVKEDEVDAELFRLFVESQVYRVAVKS